MTTPEQNQPLHFIEGRTPLNTITCTFPRGYEWLMVSIKNYTPGQQITVVDRNIMKKETFYCGADALSTEVMKVAPQDPDTQLVFFLSEETEVEQNPPEDEECVMISGEIVLVTAIGLHPQTGEPTTFAKLFLKNNLNNPNLPWQEYVADNTTLPDQETTTYTFSDVPDTYRLTVTTGIKALDQPSDEVVEGATITPLIGLSPQLSVAIDGIFYDLQEANDTTLIPTMGVVELHKKYVRNHETLKFGHRLPEIITRQTKTLWEDHPYSESLQFEALKKLATLLRFSHATHPREFGGDTPTIHITENRLTEGNEWYSPSIETPAHYLMVLIPDYGWIDEICIYKRGTDNRFHRIDPSAQLLNPETFDEFAKKRNFVEIDRDSVPVAELNPYAINQLKAYMQTEALSRKNLPPYNNRAVSGTIIQQIDLGWEDNQFVITLVEQKWGKIYERDIYIPVSLEVSPIETITSQLFIQEGLKPRKQVTSKDFKYHPFNGDVEDILTFALLCLEETSLTPSQ